MPETMSPREKVELKPCPFCGSSALLERSADHHGGWFNLGCGAPWKEEDACPGYHAFYTCDPSEETAAVAAWNRRAVLASSGDHAELIGVLRADRLPECSFDDGRTWELDGVGVAETFSRAADALEALIAEVAALRASASVTEPELGDLEATNADLSARLTEAERELSEHRITADLLVSTLKAGKEEAERKLAEAVQVILDVDRAARQAACMNDAGYTVTVERTATHIYGITDAFLSKEAERG